MNRNTIDRLTHVHPKLKCKVEQLINAVDKRQLGYEIEVVQGLRTFAEQDALYAQGRTKPGKRVTNARGGYSNHNYGLAVDLCPFKNGKPDWNAMAVFKDIGKEAAVLGLEWGGNWKSFKDYPHVQLPGLTTAQCRQLYSQGGLSEVWKHV